MNKIEEILKSQKALILDGALGTQIQKNGYDVSDSLWSAKYLDEDINVIKEVHQQYLKAGANCIITSSYQASIEGFLQKGYSYEKAIKLLKASINIAKQSINEYVKDTNPTIIPLIAASIGPYGAYLANGAEYTGIYDIRDEELKNFHKKRLEIIIEEKPDLLAIETIPSLKEARIIIEVLKEFPKIKAWLSFSCKNEKFTNANDELKVCFEYLNKQEQIIALGVNCTAPQYIAEIIKTIKQVSNKNIVVYPNGGSKYNALTKVWEKGDLSSQEFAKMAYLWFKLGAKLIGGCCETSPEDIKAIKKIIN